MPWRRYSRTASRLKSNHTAGADASGRLRSKCCPRGCSAVTKTVRARVRRSGHAARPSISRNSPGGRSTWARPGDGSSNAGAIRLAIPSSVSAAWSTSASSAKKAFWRGEITNTISVI